tara:strand:+ start:1240 stop:1524 length:285 start_codon:yes stop_codon:yes gene_type:complete
MADLVEIQLGISPDVEQVDIAYDKFKTENDMLEMSRHCKEVVAEKALQIKKLTKIVTVMYGVLTMGEIIHDDTYTIFLREYLETEMMELLGLDD